MPRFLPRERQVSWRRLIAAGLTAAGIVLGAGFATELWRFGSTDDATAARVEADVQADFSAMTQGLARVASSVASNPTAAASLDAGENGQRALFDLLRDARLGRGSTRDVAITIYDARGAARAWAGRPSDLPQGRISGASDFFVTPSPLGLRLVYVQPILASPARRVGSVAAEDILSPTPAGGEHGAGRVHPVEPHCARLASHAVRRSGR